VFGRKKRGPSNPFVHQEGCKILKADPNASIEWQEVERGSWEARCLCGVETYREPVTADRVRQDPLDPATSRHLGQCEYIGETDAAMLRVLLKVTDKATTTGSNAAPARQTRRLRTTPRASDDDEPAAAPRRWALVISRCRHRAVSHHRRRGASKPLPPPVSGVLRSWRSQGCGRGPWGDL
jgi:hypothetical protein